MDRAYIIKIVVIISLILYFFCSAFTFYQGFDILKDGKLPDNYQDNINPILNYISSILTGLVGGIVAAGFGVKTEEIPPVLNQRFESLGAMMGEQRQPLDKEKLGIYYSLVYLFVGFSSIIIWIILGPNSIEAISTIASTFLGMVVAIITSYFKP